MFLLASLLLFAAQQASPAGWAVTPYGADVQLRDRLIAGGLVHEDLGGWVVGAASPSLPGTAVDLPPLRTGEELVMVSAHAHHAADSSDAAIHGRQLWASPDGELELLAVTKEDLDLAPVFRCHGAMRAITGGRAMRPVTPATGGGFAPRGVLTPDPDVQNWVGQVSQANLTADVATMEAFGTRRHGQPGEVAAEQWLAGRMQSLGLNVSTFDYDSGADVVIGELPGLSDPSKIVIIGGHYDSINYAGSTASAPGADDDASGTSAVLEIARVLSQQQFDYTIRFCAWSGEEQGLLGSGAYASHLASIGAQVVGMVQLDMIAYREAGDTLSVDFVLNDTDPGLNAFAMDCYQAYVPTLAVNTGFLSGGTSDHRSFFQNGFPATFPFEDLGDYSPYIHGFNDVTGTSANDFQLATLITQGALATVAELARPASLQLTHSPLPDTQNEVGPYPVALHAISLTGATVTGATLHWRVDGGVWNDVAMTPTPIPSGWAADIPGQQSPAVVEYWLEASDSNARTAWLPEALSPGDQLYSFVVGQRTQIYFNDFDGVGDEGWTHAQGATQDDWQRGAPQGNSGDPSSAWSGANCWGNDLGASGWNGAYQPNVLNWLTSPTIDCSGQTGVTLRFRRWLTVEESQYDVASILVNGQEVWRNPQSGNLIDTAWTEMDLDVSQWADNNAAVEVRFQLDSDGGLHFGGWNIDDFELYALAPSTPTTDQLTLTGPANATVGQAVNYAIGNMEPNAKWWLAGSLSVSGQTFLGHAFDLGNPVTVAATGFADAAGNATASFTVPAAAGGRTVYLEAASRDAGLWSDSAPLTLTVP